MWMPFATDAPCTVGYRQPYRDGLGFSASLGCRKRPLWPRDGQHPSLLGPPPALPRRWATHATGSHLAAPGGGAPARGTRAPYPSGGPHPGPHSGGASPLPPPCAPRRVARVSRSALGPPPAAARPGPRGCWSVPHPARPSAGHPTRPTATARWTHRTVRGPGSCAPPAHRDTTPGWARSTTGAPAG